MTRGFTARSYALIVDHGRPEDERGGQDPGSLEPHDFSPSCHSSGAPEARVTLDSLSPGGNPTLALCKPCRPGHGRGVLVPSLTPDPSRRCSSSGAPVSDHLFPSVK